MDYLKNPLKMYLQMSSQVFLEFSSEISLDDYPIMSAGVGKLCKDINKSISINLPGINP